MERFKSPENSNTPENEKGIIDTFEKFREFKEDFKKGNGEKWGPPDWPFDEFITDFKILAKGERSESEMQIVIDTIRRLREKGYSLTSTGDIDEGFRKEVEDKLFSEQAVYGEILSLEENVLNRERQVMGYTKHLIEMDEEFKARILEELPKTDVIEKYLKIKKMKELLNKAGIYVIGTPWDHTPLSVPFHARVVDLDFSEELMKIPYLKMQLQLFADIEKIRSDFYDGTDLSGINEMENPYLREDLIFLERALRIKVKEHNLKEKDFKYLAERALRDKEDLRVKKMVPHNTSIPRKIGKGHYGTLDIPQGASKEEIKKAFRKLSHKYHPDRKTGDEKKFREVREAYDVLSSEKRKPHLEEIDHTRTSSFFEELSNTHNPLNNRETVYSEDELDPSRDEELDSLKVALRESLKVQVLKAKASRKKGQM